MTQVLQSIKNCKIRTMYLEDLDQVCEIEPKVFGTHHWTRNNFTQELNNAIAFYLVAEQIEPQVKIIGYAGAWIVVDEMHITTLGVDPAHRGKKVAEALLVSFLDKAVKNGVRGITLEVRLSNIPAQRLYEKYGFQRQGMRKRYYEDNLESALLLWTEDIQAEKFQSLFHMNLKNLQAQLSSMQSSP